MNLAAALIVDINGRAQLCPIYARLNVRPVRALAPRKNKRWPRIGWPRARMVPCGSFFRLTRRHGRFVQMRITAARWRGWFLAKAMKPCAGARQIDEPALRQS